ncbi:AI-2E family transporter [Streptomyces sp. MN03-5084-2B]|nr:AI-2E family transporter [Streptomyces sp. MN03-5084-2B]
MADPDGKRGLKLSVAGFRRTALLAAEVLVILLALWALRAAMANLSFVLVPLGFAALLAAFLQPILSWLCRHRVPRGLATALAMLAGAAVVAGLATIVTLGILDNASTLADQVEESLDRLHSWLRTGPWHLDDQQLSAVFDQAKSWLGAHRQALLSGSMGAFTTLGRALAGGLLAIVVVALLLYDGPKLWQFVLDLLRPSTRRLVDEAGRDAFHGVVRYVRTTALIALIDAAGIGIGLVVLQVPLALPLAALIFLGAFVPYVGAFLTGAFAVLVALVSNGGVTALIVLGVVLAVQQLEGQVLQPVLTGNFVRLHPLVVLLAIAIGGEEAGIAGALFAVPAVAAGHAIARAVARRRRQETAEGDTGSSES